MLAAEKINDFQGDLPFPTSRRRQPGAELCEEPDSHDAAEQKARTNPAPSPRINRSGNVSHIEFLTSPHRSTRYANDPNCLTQTAYSNGSRIRNEWQYRFVSRLWALGFWL